MTSTDAVRPQAAADEPLAEVVDRLRNERDGLREAMRTRSVIEQAKGMLMARYGVGADDAFDRLRAESQRRNVRLAEVAALVVAGVSPPPRAKRASAAAGPALAAAAPPASPDASPAPPTGGPVPASTSAEAADVVRARFLLVTARIEVAPDAQEAVTAVGDSRLGWPAPSSVVLTLSEPDGALRLVAHRGLTAETASQWVRIPPQVDVPLTRAAATGAAVWLGDGEAAARAYPLMSRIAQAPGACVSVPVTDDGRLLGVLGLTWPEALDLDEAARGRLVGLADAVSRAVRRWPVGPDRAAEPWVQALLDGSLTPAAVLRPVLVDGVPVDFVFEQVNDAAVASAAPRGPGLAGTSLLAAAPELGARDLVPLFRAVLADGRPRQVGDVRRVVRLGDRLFLTWRAWPAGDQDAGDLLAAGRLARLAAFRWHRSSGALEGSPNLPAVLGWPAGSGPALTPAAVARAVEPGQWPLVRRAVDAALRDGTRVDVTVGSRRGPGRLRIVAERVTDATGRTEGLRGAIQALGRARRR